MDLAATMVPHKWTTAERRRLTRESTDMRLPHDTFPAARALRRRVHCHLGPTNSGKTHHALAALSAARSGVYCGPLRLLAYEVHDRLNATSVPCHLRTGQETVEVPGAGHTACTVEMCNLSEAMDVAVLDEIQMLAHPERGWAWSRALLGLPAAELHVCGSADALPLLQSLVAACGDELVEHQYSRLTPLEVSSSIRGDLSKVRAGDCIVAFSRRDIFALKRKVEAASGLTCGVVYGSLPPETRREQARLFNDPLEAEEVLVASDAVGMGLNLNIQRVIFASMQKYDGAAIRPLEPSEVRQIAGRAGRFGSRYEAGQVTCLEQKDVAALRAALDAPVVPLAEAGLAPTFDQLQLLDRASQHRLTYERAARERRARSRAQEISQRPDWLMGHAPLHLAHKSAARAPIHAYRYAELLHYFEERARLDPRYFCCTLDALIAKAELLSAAELPLIQQHILCQTPLDAKDALHSNLLHLWARDLSRGVDARLRYAPPTRPPKEHGELQALESYFKALDGFLWLAQRFPIPFSRHAEVAADYRERTAELIEAALAAGLEPPAEPSGRRAASPRAPRRQASTNCNPSTQQRKRSRRR